MIHVGKLVHKHIKAARGKYRFKDVAEMICMTDEGLRSLTSRAHCSSERLAALGKVLEIDFFQLLSSSFRDENDNITFKSTGRDNIELHSNTRREFKLIIQNNRIVGQEEVLEEKPVQLRKVN